jgi:hypothetical protein
MILFLDGDPARAVLAYQRMTKQEKDSTIWCKTVEEAITTLKDYKNSLKVVALEHDLDGEYMNIKREDCGMEVIRWLEKQAQDEKDFEPFKNIKFIVHSWNTSAANKMRDRLHTIGLDVVYVPFGL